MFVKNNSVYKNYFYNILITNEMFLIKHCVLWDKYFNSKLIAFIEVVTY